MILQYLIDYQALVYALIFLGMMIEGDLILFTAGFLIAALSAHYLYFFSSRFDNFILIATAFIGTLPVVWSAVKALKEKEIGIDLLASVALVFSLLAREYASAAFIKRHRSFCGF